MGAILTPAPMAAVSDEPIPRLIRRFARLDGRLVATVTGTGVVVCLGFIELLRSPLQKRFAWRDFLAVKKALAASL